MRVIVAELVGMIMLHTSQP